MSTTTTTTTIPPTIITIEAEQLREILLKLEITNDTLNRALEKILTAESLLTEISYPSWQPPANPFQLRWDAAEALSDLEDANTDVDNASWWLSSERSALRELLGERDGEPS